MSSRRDEFSKYALSDTELAEAINKGLLPADAKFLRLGKAQNGEYAARGLSRSGLAARGIKTWYIRGEINPLTGDGEPLFDTFYLTDFFLIWMLPNRTAKANFKNGTTNWTYTKPDDVLVIPLKDVERCGVYYGDSYSGVIKGGTFEKDKSPIKGAVAGAVIAGPTGAVVGAIANSGTKKVTVQDRHYNMNTYNMFIEVDGNEFVSEEWLKTNNLASDTKKQSDKSNISSSNEEALRLIKRAHTDLSDEEMVKIVKESIDQSKKENQKQNLGCVVGLIVFVICILVIWMAFTW